MSDQIVSDRVLSLEEIREVLSLREKGVSPCPQVLAFVATKLEQLERHVQALVEFREELVALQQEAARAIAEGCVCGLIEKHEPHQEPDSIRLATEVLSRRPSARAR